MVASLSNDDDEVKEEDETLAVVEWFRRAVRATEPPSFVLEDDNDDDDDENESSVSSFSLLQKWKEQMNVSISDLQPKTLPELFQRRNDEDDNDDASSVLLLHFQCGICLDVLDKPVGCGTCSGRFCQSCFEKGISTTSNGQPQCPTCRRTLPIGVPDPALETRMASTFVPCRYADCTMQQIPIQQWHFHQKHQCEHRIVQCRYAMYGCSFRGTFQQEQQHAASSSNSSTRNCPLARYRELLQELQMVRITHITQLESMQQPYRQLQRQYRTRTQELQFQIQQYQTEIAYMKQTQQITNERIKQLSSYEFHNPFHLLLLIEKALIETPQYMTSSISHRFLIPKPGRKPPIVRAAAYNLLALIPMAFLSYVRIVQALFHVIYYASCKSIAIILRFAWQQFLARVGIATMLLQAPSDQYSLEFRDHVDLVWFLLMNLYASIGIGILVTVVITAFHWDEASPVEWQPLRNNNNHQTTTMTTTSWWQRLWYASSTSSSSSFWNNGDGLWQYQTIASLALAAIYYISLDFATPFPYTMKELMGILTVHGFVSLCVPVTMARVAISTPAHPDNRPSEPTESSTTSLSHQSEADASSSSSNRTIPPPRCIPKFPFLDDTATALATGNAMRPLLFALEYGALVQYLGFMTCLDGLGLYLCMMHILQLLSKRASLFFKLTGVHFYANGCMSGMIHIILHLYFVVRLFAIIFRTESPNEIQSIVDNATMAMQAHCILNGIYSVLACLGNFIGTVIFHRAREKMAATNAGAVILSPFHNIVAEGVVLCLLWGLSFIVITVDLLVASGKM